MSVEANKALWRRFYEEVWDRGNTEFAFEAFADDYVRHDLRATEGAPGPGLVAQGRSARAVSRKDGSAGRLG